MRDLTDAELFGSLDVNRSAVVRKLEGLTREQATSIVLPSGVTLLGVVRHLAWVERAWFEFHLLGGPEDPVGIDESFDVDGLTIKTVVDDYVRTCERSRSIVDQAIIDGAGSLEVRTIEPHWFFEIVTLRWILFHMTRETARHAGHMDILRELTDGQTGDF